MTSLDERKECAGSMPYRTPEIFRTPESATYSSDIWCLGIPMFELVTGRLPFEAGNELQWRVIITDEKKRAPCVFDCLEPGKPAFDNNFAKVIEKDLKKQLSVRYKSVS